MELRVGPLTRGCAGVVLGIAIYLVAILVAPGPRGALAQFPVGDPPQEDARACSNLEDDDGDGLIDLEDPGCVTPADTDETGVEGQGIQLKPQVKLTGKEFSFTFKVGCQEVCTHLIGGKVVGRPAAERGEPRPKRLKLSLRTRGRITVAGKAQQVKMQLDRAKGKRVRDTRELKRLLKRGGEARMKIPVVSKDPSGDAAKLRGKAEVVLPGRGG